MIAIIIRHLRAEPLACALDTLALAAWGAGLWSLLHLSPAMDAAIIAWRAQ